jgi:excisionase family DNA binding protein
MRSDKPLPDDARRLVTVKQAAELLSCSKANLYSLLDGGELPFVRVGKSNGYRIDVEDIMRFIDQRQVQQEGSLPKVPRPQLKHIKL